MTPVILITGAASGIGLATALVLRDSEPGATSDGLGLFLLVGAVAMLVSASAALGGKVATDRLLRQGHRRVEILLAPSYYTTGRRLRQGGGRHAEHQYNGDAANEPSLHVHF